MLPTLFVFTTYVADFLVFIAAGYYLTRLHQKETRLEKKEKAIDENYHHVVDDALSKERQILTDATDEATQIISHAQSLTQASQDSVNQAVKAVVSEIHKEGTAISQAFTADYSSSLKKVTTDSLTEFQTTMTTLQTDLKKQIHEFHDSLLPEVEKELARYKQARIEQIDKTVLAITQKAAQDILNKAIPLSEHQQLVIDALEKAKKEGVFD
jgi:vacuolar-type H+-ATPase subunit H